ncbi:hypothetical protein C9374_013423 [Naegleria lovaniensis]|uniref:Uncharacterized protein n=1 Tax=Naegleria lovaniensis TaxID=51637 RepID=A0AA88GVR9_NAELO|nr:uncharacterized protein C9374_013423 [Naegleria lovaniensis]KAG2391938.1 hypothetical protein C9374_013423 [Naegleria lovaniensis]
MFSKFKSLFSGNNNGNTNNSSPLSSSLDKVTYRWICNMCVGVIESNTVRYVNYNEKQFDLCEACFNKCYDHVLKKKKKHNSQMDDENEFEQIIEQDLEFIIPETGHYFDMKKKTESDRVNKTMFRSFIENSLKPCFGLLNSSTDKYIWMRYEQVFHLVCCIALGLEHVLQVPKKYSNSLSTTERCFVSICGKNNLDWYLCDYACLFKCIVLAPIHFAQTFDEMKHIVELTESQAIICTPEFVDRFIEIAKKHTKSVKYIIVMDEKSSHENEIDQFRQTLKDETSPTFMSFHSLMSLKRVKKNRYPKYFTDHETILTCPANTKYNINKLWIDLEHEDFILNTLNSPDDLLTLVFTSGSTGQPKGVMVKDSSLKRELDGFRTEVPRVLFSFCPLAHMSDRKHVMMGLCDGARIGIFNREFSHIFEDIQLCRPTVIASTPRIYNVLYDEFKKCVELETSKLYLTRDDSVKSETQVREQIKADFRKMLGGRIQTIIIGGASSSREVREFLSECFKCFVSDGMGSSEAGGIMNDGRVHQSVNYKLVDVPDMNYSIRDKPYPRGELCVKTETMFAGYFKNEDLTNLALDEDGWLHTGDIVEELGPKHLRIIDRLKNIFKMAQGEFVSPAKIEDVLIASKYIFQAFVYGNIKRSFLLAVIVPNATLIKKFAISEGILPSMASNDPIQNSSNHEMQDETNTDTNIAPLTEDEKNILKSNEKIKKLLLEEIEKVSMKESLLPYEIPKDILIDFEPFHPEKLLTSSMKVKRYECEKHYFNQLEELYEKIDPTEDNGKPKIIDEIRELLLGTSTGSESKNDQTSSGSSSNSNNTLKAIDSLHAVKFSGILKNKYHMEVPLSLIFSQKDQDVNAVIERVSKYINEKNSPYGYHDMLTQEGLDWKQQLLLPISMMKEISQLTHSKTVQIKHFQDLDRDILLTGCTGFLGAFILRDLLEQVVNSKKNSKVKIFCIVRREARSSETAAEDVNTSWLDSIENNPLVFKRVKKTMQEFMLWKDIYEEHIITLQGDISKPLLGLSETQFTNLAARIEFIYHNGAYVNSVMCYSQLYPSNAGSTLEILKLALLSSNGHSSLTPIILVSTVGVLQSGLSSFGFPTEMKVTKGKDEIIEDLTAHADHVLKQLKPHLEHTNGYNSTKFISEQYVQQARLLGYPSCVFRPGMIGSDSDHGISNLTDWVNRLVLGCFALRCYPSTSRSLNIIPVNIVSKVIVYMSQYSHTYFEPGDNDNMKYPVFELANTESYVMKFSDLLESAAKVESTSHNHTMGKMACVPYPKWKQKLIEMNNGMTSDDNLLRLATIFKSDYEFPSSGNQLQNYHIHKIIQALSKTDDENYRKLVPYRQLDLAYFEKQASYLVAHFSHRNLPNNN